MRSFPIVATGRIRARLRGLRKPTPARKPALTPTSIPAVIPALGLAIGLLLGLALVPGCGKDKSTPPKVPVENPLLDPTDARVNLTAPDTFVVRVTTTEGAFDIHVYRAWAPHGADRFYSLVKNGFYDQCRFFRVIFGFIAQVGINGDPAIARVWKTAYIWDDPPHPPQSNVRGTVSFASLNVADSRTTQIFINYGDNSMIDVNGYRPFGAIDAEGMTVVAALFKEYGDGPPGGAGPDQARIVAEGNPYLASFFPQLDYITTAVVLP